MITLHGRTVVPGYAEGEALVSPEPISGWSGFFQSTRLLGTAPVALVITRLSTKSALGAVVTRVPALTDLDQDPCLIIRTGDWARVDANHSLIEVKRATERN